MKFARIILCIAASVGLTSNVVYAQSKFKLQAVGNISITTQSKELEEPLWAKKIPEATSGRIIADFKPWDIMGLKGPEVFKLLSQGVFDIGNAQLGHMAGDNAINDGNDLAGLTPDYESFIKVTSAFRPILEKFYAKQNIKPLAFGSFQAQVLFCRKEIKNLMDLKGLKIRTSGASQSDFISYFGGAGINMAFGEVQQSLQTGVIDCAITSTMGGYKAKWYDGASYLYTLPINWGAGMSGINITTWKKLPPDLQKILEEQYTAFQQAIYDQNIRENDIGIACNTNGPCPEGPVGKMKLIKSPESDVGLRKKVLLERVLPQWAARCSADCVSDWNNTVGKVVGLTAKK